MFYLVISKGICFNFRFKIIQAGIFVHGIIHISNYIRVKSCDQYFLPLQVISIVIAIFLTVCAVSGNPLGQPKVCMKAKSYCLLYQVIGITQTTEKIEKMKEKIQEKLRMWMLNTPMIVETRFLSQFLSFRNYNVTAHP